jgi:hypothetical protein
VECNVRPLLTSAAEEDKDVSGIAGSGPVQHQKGAAAADAEPSRSTESADRGEPGAPATGAATAAHNPQRTHKGLLDNLPSHKVARVRETTRAGSGACGRRLEAYVIALPGAAP